MANLNVSDTIFTDYGSSYFKGRIIFINQAISTYNPEQLIFEKENLEKIKNKMNERLRENTFSPHQKTTYETYLKDVEDLINAIDARLLELAGGARKGRKSRRRKSYKRKSYKRKSIRRRTHK